MTLLLLIALFLFCTVAYSLFAVFIPMMRTPPKAKIEAAYALFAAHQDGASFKNKLIENSPLNDWLLSNIVRNESDEIALKAQLTAIGSPGAAPWVPTGERAHLMTLSTDSKKLNGPERAAFSKCISASNRQSPFGAQFLDIQLYNDWSGPATRGEIASCLGISRL